jgi:hypothetical protein
MKQKVFHHSNQKDPEELIKGYETFSTCSLSFVVLNEFCFHFLQALPFKTKIKYCLLTRKVLLVCGHVSMTSKLI